MESHFLKTFSYATIRACHTVMVPFRVDGDNDYRRVINSLRNASRGEGGHLDLLRYCLIYITSYSTERYDEGGFKNGKHLVT